MVGKGVLVCYTTSLRKWSITVFLTSKVIQVRPNYFFFFFWWSLLYTINGVHWNKLRRHLKKRERSSLVVMYMKQGSADSRPPSDGLLPNLNAPRICKIVVYFQVPRVPADKVYMFKYVLVEILVCWMSVHAVIIAAHTVAFSSSFKLPFPRTFLFDKIQCKYPRCSLGLKTVQDSNGKEKKKRN